VTYWAFQEGLDACRQVDHTSMMWILPTDLIKWGFQ
jgi:hypothetical protein